MSSGRLSITAQVVARLEGSAREMCEKYHWANGCGPGIVDTAQLLGSSGGGARAPER